MDDPSQTASNNNINSSSSSRQPSFLSVSQPSQRHSASLDTINSLVSSFSASSYSTAYLQNQQFVDNAQFCSFASNHWIKMSECDEFIGPKRSKHTMVSYGNSLYVFGGDDGKRMLNDLITYDCNNNSWGRALNASPPTPRYHHTAVVYNNSMFVFGGYTGDLNSNSNLCNKNDLYEYRFGSGTWILWNTEYNAPVPRAAHGAVVYDHKLFIFGGYDGNARLNDMWHIQLNTPQNSAKIWYEVEQTGDQPSTVCNSPLAVVQDSLYLFSGQSGAKTSNYLFKFDFKTSSWSKVSSNYILRGTSHPPERRSGHIMVAHNNHLYIYGGVLGNSFFNHIYSFDLETKTWNLLSIHTKSPIPSGRSFLAASVQNENLYVFGGNGDQNTRSNELYRFKLPNQPKSTLKEDFYRLLKKEQFCDLKFVCSDRQVVKAHCSIVACRSVYCRQLIKISREKLQTASASTTGSEESAKPAASSSGLNSISVSAPTSGQSSPVAAASTTSFRLPPFYLNEDECIEIKIQDENPEALKIVLEFLYTDCVVSLEGRENQMETLKLMVDVYKLATQFMIAKLKRICQNFLELSITCGNVLNILRYVDLHNLGVLKELCMKFLAKDSNFNQVIMLTEFEQLERPLIVEIIRLRQTPRKSTASEMVAGEMTSLEQDLENFIKKEVGYEFADLCIRLNGSDAVVYAHKSILAARCAYFEAFFRSFMPKDRKILLTIGDTVPSRQACMALLRYIYYDDIIMTPNDALCLFSASHYFQFTNSRLHVFCKQNLEANVSEENIFDILEAADKIHEKDMKDFALRIVRNNFAELAKSDGIKKLSKDLLLDIIADISNLPIRLANNSSSLNGSISSQSGASLSPAALSTLWQNAASSSQSLSGGNQGSNVTNVNFLQQQSYEDTLAKLKNKLDFE